MRRWRAASSRGVSDEQLRRVVEFTGYNVSGADLAQAWSEMTERQDKKKADVPITPDVTFSGAMA